MMNQLQSKKKHDLDFEADDVLKDDLLQIKDLIEEINFMEQNQQLKLKKLEAIQRHLQSVSKLTKEVADLEKEEYQPSLFEN